MKKILICLSFIMLIMSCSNSYHISKEYNETELKNKKLYLMPTEHHYAKVDNKMSINRYKLSQLIDSVTSKTITKQNNLKMNFGGLLIDPPTNKELYTYKEFEINDSKIPFLIPTKEVLIIQNDSLPFLLIIDSPRLQLKGYRDGYMYNNPLTDEGIISDFLRFSLTQKTGTRYTSSKGNKGSGELYLIYTSYYLIWDIQLNRAVSYGFVKKDYEPKHPYENSKIFTDKIELDRIKKDVIKQSINTILINSQFIKEETIQRSKKSKSKFMR